eukprot:s574_g21.t1
MRAPKDPVTTLKGLLGCLCLQKGKSRNPRFACQNIFLFVMHSVELKKKFADSFFMGFPLGTLQKITPPAMESETGNRCFRKETIDDIIARLDKTSLACIDAFAGHNASNLVGKFRLQAILFKSIRRVSLA